eukprot:TRINITY_DN1832_c0_g1_i2.p1 TRINITY_DN1832_c0_g1~~TRINITY_DN1832_c0_g1_i2.p1  ORF type:complete len:108 (+),score=11.87 TRINITY_DN1832_c0_g1_i2:149-472(+)
MSLQSPHRVLIGRSLSYDSPSALDACPPSPVTHRVALAGVSTTSGSPVVSALAPPYGIPIELPESHTVIEPTQHGALRKSELVLDGDGSFEVCARAAGLIPTVSTVV